MENIEKVIFGGVEYPMVEGVELETYLDAIGVPENATKDFDPVTNALHINVPSGTKGNDLEEDSEDWTEELGEWEEGLGEESEEDSEEWALPINSFTQREINYIRKNNIDTSDGEALTETLIQLKKTDTAYAKKLAHDFINDEINLTVFKRKLSVLGN